MVQPKLGDIVQTGKTYWLYLGQAVQDAEMESDLGNWRLEADNHMVIRLSGSVLSADAFDDFGPSNNPNFWTVVEGECDWTTWPRL